MELTLFQYGLITNLMSLTVAGMGAAALFFFLSRPQVAPAYRPALLLSGIVVAIACYHYFRIYGSFSGAYVLQNGVYARAGRPSTMPTATQTGCSRCRCSSSSSSPS